MNIIIGRKIKLLIFIGNILFVLVSKDTFGQQKSNPKPNILFILTDDQRWDALGYAGNPYTHTPEMDRLAKEGVYFKNAQVTTPICAASRATILSGMQERAHRYDFQTSDIKEEFMENAYPKLLKKAGYHTGFFGKLGVKYEAKSSLFDVIDDYDRNNQYKDRRGYFYKKLGNEIVHLTRYTGQQAIDFIENQQADKPFCLSLSFSAPHAHDGAPDQYFWDEQTDALLADVNIPDPDLKENKYFDILPEIVKKGFNRLRWTWRYDTPEKYQHSMKGYYRMIAGVDLEIAKIRQKLKEKGLDKNTVIIFMGDNGYFEGERQLAGKWLLYDNSIRVPMMIYDPRNVQHQDREDLSQNVDIPATILDLAGVQIPENYHGKSLMPVVWDKQKNLARDTTLIEHLWDFVNIPPSEGLKTKEWKYFRYVNDQRIEELYDLKNDPKEINNLVANPAYTQKIQQFRISLENKIREFADPTTAKPSGLTVEFIREPQHIKINDPTPEFGWIVPSGAVFQSAYQILVADNLENIKQNVGNIWNSGKVQSGASQNISFEGKNLVPGKKYYWKLRVWDRFNRTGEYSDFQTFQISNSPEIISSTNVFQIESISPRSTKMLQNNLLFADFGRAAFANLEFEYTAKKNEKLKVRIGEQLTNGRINQKPEGHIRYQEVIVDAKKGTHHYKLSIKPDERNTKPGAVVLPDSFPVLLPFRYCEIESVKDLGVVDKLIQKAYFSYFDYDQSSFTSSDTILNQVWEICKYTQKASSFSGLYLDGDRERIPYEADAYLNQLSHYSTDREYMVARKTIEYFMEHPTWPTEWQLHVPLMFYQDYLYTGNTELIERYYEELKVKTLMELRREDGLISVQSPNNTPDFMQRLGFKDPKVALKDIVDWPPAQKDTGWKLATPEGERDGYVFTPINTVVNSFFYKNMEIMAEFATLLQKPDEEVLFRRIAMDVKYAINTKLFDQKQGVYVDGEGTDHASLHANMMPLAFGLVESKNFETVVKFIKSRGMACSVYGAQYLLEGLYQAGAADYALELMTAQHDRSWWNMIKIGSTMTLEAWDTKYKPNLDWNHAWGAAPANIVARNMWGIQPKVPGGSILSIKPQLSKLKNTAIKVPSIRGSIKASFVQKSNLLKEYIFDLPANVSAELELMAGPNDDISLNGQPVNRSFGTIRLSPGKSVIEVKINTF
jgi:alpha-L-rhamnosidase